jgi:putative solute:sodium symporter small subunit
MSADDRISAVGTPKTAEEVLREVEEKAQAYWRKNISLILVLLSIWALVSYVCGILLAVPLQDVTIGSLPFGFWFAQQGSIITFMILILVYAVTMDRIDREFDLNE